MEEKVLNEEEIFLFNQGTYYRGYCKFGAHPGKKSGKPGTYFALWAPNVESVTVVGTFNGWRDGEHVMTPVQSSGIWQVFIPDAKKGDLYKYVIEKADGGKIFKADPYAFEAELRPGTASRITDLEGYLWNDRDWLKKRRELPCLQQPFNIYEVHLGSWKHHETAPADKIETYQSRFYTYRELAATLVPYVVEMGYTHIELMPVMEHPFDGSWGYQVTGYYSPTSRYGTPGDFMYFVDTCHQAGIGVILDWVPGHFCRDSHGLGLFTGEALFEIEDHGQWGTYKFDFGRPEVKSFLISNALFWLDQYHIDGFRVDGVSSMLCLNFGIEDESKFRKNIYGGDGDLNAISFIQEFNRAVGTYYPDVFTAAEESAAWPLVTFPPEAGGLGFHLKWDMGWMNDTLRYMELDFDHRSKNHNLLTFSMMYAFSENFLLPLSHDEVVHGKKSLIGRMPGDYWRQFAGLRLLALYQMCHTGAKLNFMGNEIGQFIEWRYYEGIEWFLLDYETHSKHQNFIKHLNKLYLQEKALWELNFDRQGFTWLDPDNSRQNILVFIRKGTSENDLVIVVLNFAPETYEHYRIGVPVPGSYRELINSDDIQFGGSGKVNFPALLSKEIPAHNQKCSVEITVPPLGGTVIKHM